MPKSECPKMLKHLSESNVKPSSSVLDNFLILTQTVQVIYPYEVAATRKLCPDFRAITAALHLLPLKVSLNLDHFF